MFSDLTGLDIFFLVCAGAGGIMFLLRLVLQLIGSDHGVDACAGLVHGDVGHGDADVSFKILTLQGLTSFFVMFGLVGFALHKQSHVGALFSIAGAVAVGLGTVWIMGKLFATAGRLQSSGTVDVTSAIGGEGTVYVTIPPKGTGVVQVVFKNHLREFDAVSHNREEIKTGERVRVTWLEGNVLFVEKV